jgi:mannan endo-1,4-beta-mannosidase
MRFVRATAAFQTALLTVASVVFCLSCRTTPKGSTADTLDTLMTAAPADGPVDSLLTPATKALWMNLRRLQGRGILFGQQEATLSGINGRISHDDSDVKTLTGNHPALYGWEIGGIGDAFNIDSISFALIKQRIISAFERGGVNTVIWHMNNPVTGGNSMDVSRAVNQILPDSIRHEIYKEELKKAGGFFNSLATAEGIAVPIIFRPFQESNGNWFWWGRDHCSADEYIALWQFTVSYLRDSCHVHNLLYVYSTDIFSNREDYLERYPGDLWVDILGCENYWDFQSGASVSNGVKQLGIISEMALQKKKLAALTECGFNGIPVKNWWTQFLLMPIRQDSLARNISYVMVWRNINRKHFYTPFPGQKSSPDFIAFEKDSFTLFQQDVHNLYK